MHLCFKPVILAYVVKPFLDYVFRNVTSTNKEWIRLSKTMLKKKPVILIDYYTVSAQSLAETSVTSLWQSELYSDLSSILYRWITTI